MDGRANLTDGAVPVPGAVVGSPADACAMSALRKRRWSKLLAVGVVAMFSLMLAAGAAAYRSFVRLPT
jgi:hypothetical protein